MSCLFSDGSLCIEVPTAGYETVAGGEENRRCRTNSFFSSNTWNCQDPRIAEQTEAHFEASQREKETKPNRGAPWSKKRAAASNKSERKTKARTRRQSIKSKRRPRAMKVPWNKAEITAKASKAAYRKLVVDRWAWKPPRCQCGSKFHEVPWRTCLSRGYGRLFVRCYSCGRILPSISTVTAIFFTLVSCNYGHT